MTDQLLLSFEEKLDQLIQWCEHLSEENARLQQAVGDARRRESDWQLREADWNTERTRLVEKNELAKNRVEAMISRLKNLEEQA